MKPEEALAHNVKVRREQYLGVTQADLAEGTREWGLHLDASAITRIERRQRDVRAGELLRLAAALMCCPSDLILPPDGDVLELGDDHQLEDRQVLAWFAGDNAAPLMPQRDRDYFERTGGLNVNLQLLLELVDATRQAMEEDRSADAVYWLLELARMANSLGMKFYDDVLDKPPANPAVRAAQREYYAPGEST